MDLTERTVESKTLFEGIIVTLKVDQAQLPVSAKSPCQYLFA